MICKCCSREIVENSIYCSWCGKKQLRERKSASSIKIPEATRLPSGSWHIYLRSEGVSVTESTKEKCEAKARALRAGFIERKDKLPRINMKTAIDLYVKDRVNSLSPATLQNYRCLTNTYLPHLMGMSISTEINWQSEVNKLLATHRVNTVKSTYRLISTVLRSYGVKMPDVTYPKEVPVERPFLMPEQILAFMDAIRGDDSEIALLLGLHGLRLSEIQGLRWQDVNLSENTLHICGSIVRGLKGQFVYKEGNKTDRSTRTIPIMIDRLRELLHAATPTDGFVVTIGRQTITRRVHAFGEKIGVPDLSPHCLRHSFASLGYYLGGISEMTIMQLGGWSNTETIHRIYLHLSDRERLKAENRMAKFYRTAEKLPKQSGKKQKPEQE